MERIVSLPIDRVHPNPDQPRKTFKDIEELAASITANGLIQPITVRKAGKDWEIIAGERRWRACQLAKLKTIDGRVVTATDLERDISAIIENLQRSDIEPLEEANAFQRLIDDGLSVEEIATRLGLAAFRVRWRLSLLALDPGIKTLFSSGQLDRQQALEIARLPNHQDQRKIVSAVNSGALVGWKAVRNAVDNKLDRTNQIELFTSAEPPAAADLQTVSDMEAKISRVAASIAAGWQDGACIIATKIDPGRARHMADKLDALVGTLRTMARELRNTAAQAPLASLGSYADALALLTQKENA